MGGRSDAHPLFVKRKRGIAGEERPGNATSGTSGREDDKKSDVFWEKYGPSGDETGKNGEKINYYKIIKYRCFIIYKVVKNGYKEFDN